MSGFQSFAPLQLPTAVAGVLYKAPEIREGKKGYFVTGKLKVAGGGFLGFISFDEAAVQLLGDCSPGEAVYLHGFVKAGKPYPSKQSGELIGTLDLTVEHAERIEHEGRQNVRSERQQQPPQNYGRAALPTDHGTAGGETLEKKQEGFDDDIPF